LVDYLLYWRGKARVIPKELLYGTQVRLSWLAEDGNISEVRLAGGFKKGSTVLLLQHTTLFLNLRLLNGMG
jgi:hypothetical protein